jgi:hypothetical protein
LSTTIGIGFSQIPDPQKAALQACVQIKNILNSSDTDLLIVFVSPEYVSQGILDMITRSLRPKRLVGSSTGAIILSDGVTAHGIAIVGINSDEMSFGISVITDINNQDMRRTGFELAKKAIGDMQRPQREMFLTFSEGIEKDNTQFIRGIKDVFGGGFPVIGAISSDDFKYKQLNQFFQDQILQNSTVGVLLGGASAIALGCKHGFKPLGKPRTITQVDGHLIRTIDNKPAVDIYKHFLGAQADQLKNVTLNSHAAMYPLGIYTEEDRQYLLRNIIDILEDGSIVCQGGIPQGAEVHLMISNKDSCHQSAVSAAEAVKNTLGGKQAKLILVFESLARHKILGRSVSGEIMAIREILGPKTPLAGMCSYGEIAPFGSLNNIKNIYLHNESILIVAIA